MKSVSCNQSIVLLTSHEDVSLTCSLFDATDNDILVPHGFDVGKTLKVRVPSSRQCSVLLLVNEYQVAVATPAQRV